MNTDMRTMKRTSGIRKLSTAETNSETIEVSFLENVTPALSSLSVSAVMSSVLVAL